MAIASERDLLMAPAFLIVGILARHFAQRSIALDIDEGIERIGYGTCLPGGNAIARNVYKRRRAGIDIKHRAICVLYFPHQYHTDHYRIAHFIIDLDGRDVHIADSQ